MDTEYCGRKDSKERALRGARAFWLSTLGSLVALSLTGCGVSANEHEEETRPTIAFPTAGSTSTVNVGAGGSSTGTPVASTGGSGATPVASSAGAGNTPVTAPPAGMVGTPPASSMGGASTLDPMVANGGAAEPAEVLSGITVNINGVDYPKEKVIAFIHFGHSNMAGRGVAPQELRPFFFEDVNPNAVMYHPDRGFEPALEPFTAGDDRSMTNPPGGGPGTALVKLAAEAAPGYVFVSLGYGHNAAYCSQFRQGALYYDEVMNAARDLKGKVTFGAIIVMLGITERHGTEQDITGYPDCINAMATDIRNEVEAPDIPLLLTDYEMETTGALNPTSAFAQEIIPEIHRVPDVVTNSALVPTEDLGMFDDHHFNLDGQRDWSQRAIDIMRTNGWFPWGSE